MHRETLCAAVALAAILSAPSTSRGDGPSPTRTAGDGSALFGLDKLWEFHLILTPEAWDAM